MGGPEACAVRTRVDQAAGYLALTLGLYVVAAALSFAQVAGMWGAWAGSGWATWLPPAAERAQWGSAWGAGLGYVFCVGVAVYLLDRVKLSDARLDPADAVAHPERAAFIARHSGAVRGLMMAMFAAGAACGAWVWWGLLVVEAAACAGVVVYAGKPRVVRARPKDVLVLKNACIGGAITGFVVVTVWVTGMGQERGWAGVALVPVLIGAAQLFVRVMADSIICDLEDEEADRAFGTATLATRFGTRVAWNVASAMRLAVGAGLIAAGVIGAGVGGGSGAWSWKWGVVTIVSTVALRLADPKRVRDWTDMRFPIEAAAVMVWVGVG